MDILPKWANKGNALIWLLRKLDLESNNTLVAGDSGNDTAMFDVDGVKGIVVANAHEELYRFTKHREVYHSESENGDGVIEGLIYYGILPEDAKIINEDNHTDDYIIQQELNIIAEEDDDEKLQIFDDDSIKMDDIIDMTQKVEIDKDPILDDIEILG